MGYARSPAPGPRSWTKRLRAALWSDGFCPGARRPLHVHAHALVEVLSQDNLNRGIEPTLPSSLSSIPTLPQSGPSPLAVSGGAGAGSVTSWHVRKVANGAGTNLVLGTGL
eukprot:scaffold5382_cov405-Prasinococcus_capsulatus_cf.AAC.6